MTTELLQATPDNFKRHLISLMLPKQLNPDLPEAFCSFITRATQKEPSLRYDDLGQVLNDLNSIAKRTTQFEFAEPMQSRKRMMSLLMFYEEYHQLVRNHHRAIPD